MEEQKIDINLTDEVAQGHYSNLTIITHSDNEFIMDFVQMMPGVNKGQVRSRVIMTPKNAKRLLRALTENLGSYEKKMGVIDEGPAPQGFPPLTGGQGLA
ncbi:MAG: DUF3467 domain-containing protein [Bacteroidales bacterium]|nr:DUF3467 domain-containing protein [Bacteroidales bacterium]